MTLPPDARILRELRDAPQPLTLAELGQETGLELPALQRRLGELRAAGFVIEQHPTLGCRLLASPDRLIADDLWARLGTEEHGWLREILVLAETASTNDVAMRLGAEGAEGVLVVAESQTAGRGRFGRAWSSAPGRGLWFSLVLRPPLPLAQWTRLTTWAAVAVALALGRPAKIKWPNDVLIDGRKVAGILIEVSGSPNPFAVVGIGLNVNHTAEDFPPELAGSAQSLRMADGKPWDRAWLLCLILHWLHQCWNILGHDFPWFVKSAEKMSSLLGQAIQVRMGETLLTGVAEALDEEGRLLLRRPDGTLLPLTAGEVTLRAE